MTRSLTLVAVAVAVVFAAMPARAQSPTRQVAPLPGTGQTQSTIPDALFAAAAGSGGLAGLNMSQIGLQRATDLQLKQFSQRMIDDHTKLNRQLINVVTRKGIIIPEAIDARAQFCAESLAGLSGEKFDECYAKAQLVMHMDAVATFEAEAHRGQDPDIKALPPRPCRSAKSTSRRSNRSR